MLKEKDISIGTKVRYNGKAIALIGCTGTIVRIFTKFPDDLYQHVEVLVDELPEFWPYNVNTFAPPVNELELLKND